MQKLTRESLMSLEQYAQTRQSYRQKVMEHKKDRRLSLGDHLTLYFEDLMTIQYQVQEMLRVERIFEVDGIEEELAAYNPLIPDGTNWKATMMIEYTDVQDRQEALRHLCGVEDKVWVRIGDAEKVYAVADEDLERSTDEKTSAVHFLRFELSQQMIQALKSGAEVSAGVDHEAYSCSLASLPAAVTNSLIGDLA